MNKLWKQFLLEAEENNEIDDANRKHKPNRNTENKILSVIK